MAPEQFSDLTPNGRRVVALAEEEARRFNHYYLGTEHLLLGLVRDEGSLACQVLCAMGVELGKVRNAIEFIIGRGERAPISQVGLTPRARKVVALAVDEARRLGDPLVGPEHLLLGLVREGEGIAAGVLESLGVSLPRLRRRTLRALGREMEADLEPEPPESDGGSGLAPDRGWEHAERTTQMQNDRFDRFSQRARQVLALAQEEAQRFNHNYIGTEHLLLGLVREGEGVAAKVLTNLGVDLQKVRRAVETIIGRGNRAPHGEIGLTPRARKVIELGADEARRLGHRYIGTEHLLLGLVREGEGIAAGVLERLGVDLEKVRQQTVLVLSQSIPTAGRSGWRSSGPGRPPGPPGAEQPLPHLGHLRRVVPVAQTTHHGEVDLTVLSLEDYDAGFRVLVRVMATGPDRPTAGSAYFPFAQTDLTADDDRGGSYVPVRRDRRGGDQEWRFELDFTPSLDPAARQLRLEVPPDPASGAAPASAQPDISQAQPWTLFIPLPA